MKVGNIQHGHRSVNGGVVWGAEKPGCIEEPGKEQGNACPKPCAGPESAGTANPEWQRKLREARRAAIELAQQGARNDKSGDAEKEVNPGPQSGEVRKLLPCGPEAAQGMWCPVGKKNERNGRRPSTACVGTSHHVAQETPTRHLRRWTRAGDENLHEPSGAFGPVRYG